MKSHKRGPYKNAATVMSPQWGLSLVELMIALALSVTLILGIFTVYMDSSRTARVGEGLARVQESGRIGLEIMSKEVRMAGFQGCADAYTVPVRVIADNPPPSLTPATGEDTLYFYNSALLGWEVTAATQASWENGTDFDSLGIIQADALPDSDVLMVQRARLLSAAIANSTSASVSIEDPNGLFGAGAAFSSGSLLMIAGCENADIFRLTNNPTGTPKLAMHGSGKNSSDSLSIAYAADEDAEVYALDSTVFFVADTGRLDDNGNTITALYRATNNFPESASPSFQREELVEGVESMQIQYGLRINATNNTIRYVSAPAMAASDWKDVVVIRVGLLVSAGGNAMAENDSQTYELPGQTFVPSGPAAGELVHAADRRLRKAFVSTLGIRNRRCGEFRQFGATDFWEWETADNNGGDGDPCN